MLRTNVHQHRATLRARNRLPVRCARHLRLLSQVQPVGTAVSLLASRWSAPGIARFDAIRAHVACGQEPRLSTYGSRRNRLEG